DRQRHHGIDAIARDPLRQPQRVEAEILEGVDHGGEAIGVAARVVGVTVARSETLEPEAVADPDLHGPPAYDGPRPDLEADGRPGGRAPSRWPLRRHGGRSAVAVAATPSRDGPPAGSALVRVTPGS